MAWVFKGACAARMLSICERRDPGTVGVGATGLEFALWGVTALLLAITASGDGFRKKLWDPVFPLIDEFVPVLDRCNRELLF